MIHYLLQKKGNRICLETITVSLLDAYNPEQSFLRLNLLMILNRYVVAVLLELPLNDLLQQVHHCLL